MTRPSDHSAEGAGRPQNPTRGPGRLPEGTW